MGANGDSQISCRDFMRLACEVIVLRIIKQEIPEKNCFSCFCSVSASAYEGSAASGPLHANEPLVRNLGCPSLLLFWIGFFRLAILFVLFDF